MKNLNQNFNNSQKIVKLKYLLQNLKKEKMLPVNKTLILEKEKNYSDNLKNLSKDLSLYLSLIEKPINLLFSIDQFLFEFSKKTYQQKKTGEFFQQLKERKKLSLFYGYLTKKQIMNLFDQVKKNKGSFSKNIFSLLERRLDVVVYRSGIAKTITEARQLIKHKKILVNQNLVNIPSYLLDPGDFISLISKTGDSLSDQLVKSIKNQAGSKNRDHPQIFGDFYSKLKKTIDSCSSQNTVVPKTKFLEKEKRKEKTRMTRSQFQSRLFCNLLIELISIRIKLRSYLNYKQNLCDSYSNINKFNSKANKLTRPEKTIMLKWKTVSFLKTPWLQKDSGSKNIVFGKGKKPKVTRNFSQKKETFFLKKHSFFRSKIGQQDTFYANEGSLQKQPIFWSKNFYKNIISLKINSIIDKKKSQIDKKTLKNVGYKNKNLYRKCFLSFLKFLDNYEKFHHFVTLSLKKSLFKKSLNKQNLSKLLTFRIIKPIHIEVSYNLLNVIYLYSPQRVNFPFYIDLDLIYRSLR